MGAYYVNHGNLTTINPGNRYDNTACSAARMPNFTALTPPLLGRTQHWYQNDFSSHLTISSGLPVRYKSDSPLRSVLHPIHSPKVWEYHDLAEGLNNMPDQIPSLLVIGRVLEARVLAK